MLHHLSRKIMNWSEKIIITLISATLGLRKNIILCSSVSFLPCQVGLVVSMSASHTVGRDFASLPCHTIDHHKNGTNYLLLRMIPGDLLSAFPHRQFHTLPGLLDSWAALPNSYPDALRAMQGGSLYHFYDGLWYDPAERRTHDLPYERRTRYQLSQPNTVNYICRVPLIDFLFNIDLHILSKSLRVFF